MSNVTVVNDSNFDSEVSNSNVPVAVDFWAQWCGPCRILSPVMDEVADEMADKVKVCKLNVDENPVTANKYGVMSIPTVIIFKNGRAVDQLVGLQPKQALIDHFKKAA